MRTNSKRRGWPRLLLSLLPVLMLGCWRHSQPQEPRMRTVEIQVTCPMRDPPPDHVSEILDCSTLGNSVEDCQAHALVVRDAWIRAAILRCGVSK